MSGFRQLWTCPKCGEPRLTHRQGKSEGKVVPTYCSMSCGTVKVLVTKEEPRPVETMCTLRAEIARLAADNARLTRELSEASHAGDAYKVIADGREGIEEFSHMKSDEIEALRARVAYLEQENARLASALLRREGEIEAESRRER